ncbi:site-specific integrase [Bizionia gelidisalsuginis]|uniref:Site-specific integrase n=1 Tax=Bizionia gelidisalsuginis TaxID=291188 RepID=A0ABY3MEK0_9FLAO|nr:site-specific integrase [Bizionia gelidisalsuginis]TYC18035.1 site-specific integrase [Bizionia gelidisalsuginis]
MINVTLRQKKIANGKLSLYLDFYPEIVDPRTGKSTRREFLKLKIHELPLNEMEKAHNKETIQFAELIRSKRLLQLRDREYGFKENINLDVNFISFFELIAEEALNKTTHKNYLVWMAAMKYFQTKYGSTLKTREINKEHLRDFRSFLLSTNNLRSKIKKPLSVNTAATYYKKFMFVLKEAYKRKLLDENLAEFAEYIKERQTFREYLDEAELKTLWNTPIKIESVKHMALFSALSGLRFVDISALEWASIYNDKHQGSYIKLHEKKTNNISNLPLSDAAMRILKLQGTTSGKVFPEMEYSRIVKPIQEWIKLSGINKKISFHNFRHSFATLQLANGTDIYTVSKLLGHKNVSTTQIYTKVMDRNKVEAVNRINLDLDGL